MSTILIGLYFFTCPQMDHHCIWMNNCVGYNNYRTFLWTLIYLAVGCWYGVSILFGPFYKTIEKQVETKGWKFFYENNSGFLDLPMPLEIIRKVRVTGKLDADIALKLVVPLLIGVGIFLTSFLCSHLSFVKNGLTTLEQMAVLTFNENQAFLARKGAENNQQEQSMKVVNPYDQGWYKNFVHIMGPSILLGTLPFNKTKMLVPLQRNEIKLD